MDFLVFVLVCVEPILHLTGSKVDLGGRLISKIDSHHLKAVDFTFGWTSNNRGLPSSKTGVIILIVLEPFDDYKVVIFLQVTSSFVSILICRGIINSGFPGFCWIAGLLGVDFLEVGVARLAKGVAFFDVDFI